jgi:hypothetical protein
LLAIYSQKCFKLLLSYLVCSQIQLNLHRHFGYITQLTKETLLHGKTAGLTIFLQTYYGAFLCLTGIVDFGASRSHFELIFPCHEKKLGG